MEGTHQEPQPAPRIRVPNRVHVDLMHSAAAGQLVITAHVDMEHGGRKRRIPTADFEAYLTRRLQAIIDVGLAFVDEAPVAAAVEPPGAPEQPFDASEASGSAPEAAEPGSAAQEGQS